VLQSDAPVQAFPELQDCLTDAFQMSLGRQVFLRQPFPIPVTALDKETYWWKAQENNESSWFARSEQRDQTTDPKYEDATRCIHKEHQQDDYRRGK
jgi:hypothetical protein